jgi:formylglycine-generating enzyme required for sulfatase activity
MDRWSLFTGMESGGLEMANASVTALAIIAAALSSVGVPNAGAEDPAPAALWRTSEDASASDSKSKGAVFRDCGGGCPEMVTIPAGSFLMGSERYSREQPQHKVTIIDAIAIGRYETTFDDWEACVSGGGCVHNRAPSDEGWGKGRRPVINVSWTDAKEYVAWLSRRTGKKYRLLTEADWEYAARAGSRAIYPWGDNIDCGKAAYDGGPGSDCAAHAGDALRRGTQLVGSHPANKFGLYDMIGNVWEWCEDNWHPDYRGAPGDGAAWDGGDASMRILRGGAWNYGPSALRTADRNWYPLSGRTFFIGFRVVREVEPGTPEKKLSDLGGYAGVASE